MLNRSSTINTSNFAEDLLAHRPEPNFGRQAYPYHPEVQIAVRINPKAGTRDDVAVTTLYDKFVSVNNECLYEVDYVLPANCDQSTTFLITIVPQIDRLLEGSNIYVIAYGNAGTGKTYTILGPGVNCTLSESEYGFIPRAAREIFRKLQETKCRTGTNFYYRMSVSFYEVFGEEIRDLLSSEPYDVVLKLNNSKGGAFLDGLEEIECHSACDVINCLQNGRCIQNRGLYDCADDLKSSSHCFFTFTIHQEWVMQGRKCDSFKSKATFVDMACYEIERGVRPSGEIFYKKVNSHVCLQELISLLNTLQEDSLGPTLLGILLKDAFLGSVQTLLVCCLSPYSMDKVDTVNCMGLTVLLRNMFPSISNKGSSNTDVNTCSTNVASDCVQYKQSLLHTPVSADTVPADSFGLEFAASQWVKLISNAEGLLKKLKQKASDVSEEEKAQIEQWLCLKQECEECLATESSPYIPVRAGLEPIDEVTETEDINNSEITKSPSNTSSNSSISRCDSEINEDYESFLEHEKCEDDKSSGFTEKLTNLIHYFRNTTDTTVDRHAENMEPQDVCEEKRVLPDSQNAWTGFSSRRKVIHTGKIGIHQSTLSSNQDATPTMLTDKAEPMSEDIKFELVHEEEKKLDVTKELVVCKQAKIPIDHLKELRLLSSVTEAKQSQIDLLILDMEGAHKRLKELQYTIQIKEQFIDEMVKNSGVRTSAKARFQRKHSKLQEEYLKARTQLAKAEKLLNEGGGSCAQDQVNKCKAVAIIYEKRIRDIEMIKQIAGDSAKKVLELENSLHNSKRKMQKLKKQLKKEEEHKSCLEQELLDDQKRIKALEEKYRLQLNIMPVEEGAGEERLRLIAAEEKRLLAWQESSQRLQQQLQLQQTVLEKRELLLKEKLCQEKHVTKNLMLVSARISHLEQVLKVKSTNLELADDIATKEALRHEIRNLRKTRDCLVKQRHNLDAKFNKDKMLSTIEERKFLECDEAIEAIDATIEYKNEIMCGRKGFESCDGQREKGEEMLMDRLMRLSATEMRTLLYKYFQKVIDLRESGRKMEQQIAELDQQSEAQAWKIQALSNALQQTHLESERRLVVSQREHQEKLNLMFRHFAAETSGVSSASSLDQSGIEKLRHNSKAMRQRLIDVTLPKELQPNTEQTSTPLSIPKQNLKQLQGAGTPLTTKVTRQKNKLIIQQQKVKK